MPSISLRNISETEKGKHILVIVLSGYDSNWPASSPILCFGLCLALRVERSNSSLDCSEIAALVQRIWPCYLSETLANSVYRLTRAYAILSKTHNQSQGGETSPFESLPAEIISMILSDPSLDSRDIVSLGLSCRSLWTNVLEHVVRKCQTAPWAGTPLLCTGTWTMSLPPAIHALRPEIEQEEREFFSRPGRGPRGCPARGMCPARRFNWNAYGEYFDRNEHCNSSMWLDSFSAASQNAAAHQTYLNVLRQSLETVVVPKRSRLSTSWVLRNHTTKECISLKRGPPHSKQEQYVHVKGVPWLTLDKALLLRICWSASHADLGWGYDDDEVGNVRQRVLSTVKRGTWAGHCFDVVPSTEHSKSSAEEWSDVTKIAAKEAVAWRTMFKQS